MEDPLPVAANLPAFIEVGEIRCPVSQQLISRYFAPREDNVPSFYLSHFTENRIIGHGGFAIVAECTNNFDGHQYAIKKMAIGHNPDPSHCATLPEAVGYASVIREVTTWSGLEHENIVRYYEAWTEKKFNGGSDWEEEVIDITKPSLYLQLELCDSVFYRALREKLKPGPNCMEDWLTLEDLKKTFKDLVNGLDYIHGKNIMHGDLNPDNILYRNGVAKITDFGLARIIGEEDDVDVLVADSVYRAPEREGEQRAKPDCNADIFSLGIILFEMLQPFSTVYGRLNSLKDLKDKRDLPESWAELPAKEWVMHMITHPPPNRPTAAYLKENIPKILEDIQKSKVVSGA